MSEDFIGNYNITENLKFAKGITMLDDMEGSNNWVMSAAGTDYVTEFSTLAAYFGTQGLRLKSRTEGAAEDQIIQAYRLVPYPQTGLAVLRGMFCMPSFSTCKKLRIAQRYRRDDEYVLGGIDIYPNTPKLEFIAESGMIQLTEFDREFCDACWYKFETVLDLRNKHLVEVTFMGIRVEVNVEAENGEDVGSFRLGDIYFIMTTAGAAPVEIYFDAIYVGDYQRL